MRRLLGCLPLAYVLLLSSCEGKKGAKAGGTDLDKRCETLGPACGDNDKHAAKIVEECKAAAKKHADAGCGDKALALYTCLEKEVCGKDDKVWALEDLRVLADRRARCVVERDAIASCGGK